MKNITLPFSNKGNHKQHSMHWLAIIYCLSIMFLYTEVFSQANSPLSPNANNKNATEQMLAIYQDENAVIRLNKKRIDIDQTFLLEIETQNISESKINILSDDFFLVNRIFSSQLTYQNQERKKISKIIFSLKAYKTGNAKFYVQIESKNIGPFFINVRQSKKTLSPVDKEKIEILLNVPKNNLYVHEPTQIILYAKSEKEIIDSSIEREGLSHSGLYLEVLQNQLVNGQISSNEDSQKKLHQIGSLLVYPFWEGEHHIEGAKATIYYYSKQFFGYVRRKEVLEIPKITIRGLPYPEKKETSPGNISSGLSSANYGTAELTVQLNKTNVQLGEPLEITVQLDGSGNLNAMSFPQYVSDNFFRVSQNIQVKKDYSFKKDSYVGSKIMRQYIFFTQVGEISLPKLYLTQFDRTKGWTTKTFSAPTINVIGQQPKADMVGKKIFFDGASPNQASTDIIKNTPDQKWISYHMAGLVVLLFALFVKVFSFFFPLALSPKNVSALDIIQKKVRLLINKISEKEKILINTSTKEELYKNWNFAVEVMQESKKISKKYLFQMCPYLDQSKSLRKLKEQLIKSTRSFESEKKYGVAILDAIKKYDELLLQKNFFLDKKRSSLEKKNTKWFKAQGKQIFEMLERELTQLSKLVNDKEAKELLLSHFSSKKQNSSYASTFTSIIGFFIPLLVFAPAIFLNPMKNVHASPLDQAHTYHSNFSTTPAPINSFAELSVKSNHTSESHRKSNTINFKLEKKLTSVATSSHDYFAKRISLDEANNTNYSEGAELIRQNQFVAALSYYKAKNKQKEDPILHFNIANTYVYLYFDDAQDTEKRSYFLSRARWHYEKANLLSNGKHLPSKKNNALLVEATGLNLFELPTGIAYSQENKSFANTAQMYMGFLLFIFSILFFFSIFLSRDSVVAKSIKIINLVVFLLYITGWVFVLAELSKTQPTLSFGIITTQNTPVYKNAIVKENIYQVLPAGAKVKILGYDKNKVLIESGNSFELPNPTNKLERTFEGWIEESSLIRI